MSVKFNYKLESPISSGLGMTVAGLASMNPVTSAFANQIGTMAAGVFGGVNLTVEELNIKAKFDNAINKTWHQISVDYKLTSDCLLELKREVIGENTSTNEFVDNLRRKRLEESYALVIQTILERHDGALRKKSKKLWDEEYKKNVSKEIASRLISTLQNIYNEDDLLKILKALADSREVTRKEHELLEELIKKTAASIIQEIQKQGINDFHRHYKVRHLISIENSETPYVKDLNLFNIIDGFIKYEWEQSARKLMGKTGNDISEDVKKQISELLFSNIPFRNRITNFKNSSICQDSSVKNFRDKLIKLTFGNCLFISGRYGVGKTRLLKRMEVSSDSTKTYTCYLDLLDTNGQLDNIEINKLINRYFGKSYEDMESFLTDYLEKKEQQKIIIMVDNLDFAFQRGLRSDKLLELIESYSICDKLKWIFTMQSGQRYLVWSNTNMDKLASNYGYVSADEPYNAYYRGNDLDMDRLSSDARVFESILRAANSVESSEEICLRNNHHQYDAYLTPFVAEILVRLEWKWEELLKTESLVYLDLCQNYKNKKFENLSVFNTSGIPSLEWNQSYNNLCVDIGLFQLKTGLNNWGKDDIVGCSEQVLIPLESEELITKEIVIDSYGHWGNRCTAFDRLFWSEQNAEILINSSDSFGWEEKLNSCTVSSKPDFAKLPYFTDMQQLYYLKLFQKEKLFDARKSEEVAQGTIPENIISLFSTQLYPLAANALSYADEDSQKMFFESSLIYLEGIQEHMEKLDTYTFLSSFFEFCVSTTLSEEDWKKMVSKFPTKFTGLLMKNTIQDFSNLLWKKQSELKGDLLGCILAYLGNEDAEVFDPISSMISKLYHEEYPDNSLLIKTLLADKKLRNLGKRYVPSCNYSVNSRSSEKNKLVIVHREVFPYCVAESTISKICNRIIMEEGIIKGYDLFWKNRWYAAHIKDNLPFFVELRRKSLNLALADCARKRDCIDDLEILITQCLNYSGSDHHLKEVYKEEAFYLCRNSVLAEDRNPMSFTDIIYGYLTKFVNDRSMSKLMRRKEVRVYYAKHNLFALFNHHDVTLQLNGNREKVFQCYVMNYTRENITVKMRNQEVKTINWREIAKIIEKSEPQRVRRR